MPIKTDLHCMSCDEKICNLNLLCMAPVKSVSSRVTGQSIVSELVMKVGKHQRENNVAVVYVESSLTGHNPLFLVPKL